MAKDKNKLNPYLLFVIATALFSAGLLMRSFPLFVFFGLAPLFAITDHANEDNMWNKIELIGVSIVVSLFAWHVFDFTYATSVILLSIGIMLVFAAFTFARSGLGSRLGLLPLILFWLALEYLMLRFAPTKNVFFLADAVVLKTAWLRWNTSMGYLSASLWILMTNWFLYLGTLKNGIRIPYLVIFLIVISGPIIYSYTLQAEPVSRAEMIALYTTNLSSPASYAANGEWIPRTAAWVSVLILLSAFVKENIRKK